MNGISSKVSESSFFFACTKLIKSLTGRNKLRHLPRYPRSKNKKETGLSVENRKKKNRK